MAITAAALRELHRLHRQLTDLRERLEKGPKQIRAGEANLKRLEQTLADAKENYKRARIASDDKQLQLKQRENRIADLKAKLNACSSNKEYQALKEQIAADEQASSVLLDEILEMLENIDELQRIVTDATSNLAKVKEDVEKSKTRVVEQQVGLETELVRVSAELEKAEASLPDDFKADYARIVKGRGENALAPVDGECCGGCFQMLSPQTMNELYLSRAVYCKSCGCLLYLPEDRTVGQ